MAGMGERGTNERGAQASLFALSPSGELRTYYLPEEVAAREQVTLRCVQARAARGVYPAVRLGRVWRLEAPEKMPLSPFVGVPELVRLFRVDARTVRAVFAEYGAHRTNWLFPRTRLLSWIIDHTTGDYP